MGTFKGDEMAGKVGKKNAISKFLARFFRVDQPKRVVKIKTVTLKQHKKDQRLRNKFQVKANLYPRHYIFR